MTKHVIVGAGPVGSATARLLADAGHEVHLVTRSGSGPDDPRIVRTALDATDAAALTRTATGADALYNCANPAYHRWPIDWPPLAASLLTTAETTGAVLVTVSNLYGYGPLDHPMTEADPLATTGTKGKVRAGMWHDALAAHDAGRVRATEARASDFVGNGANGHLDRVVPRVLAGKGARVLGDPDAPHSWTFVPDVARTLVALGADERAWGRPWHVPSNPPRSQREAITDLARAAGLAPVKVGAIPLWALRAAGVFSPMMRELQETHYQFDRPFVLDSSAVTATFGLEATPWDDVVAATVAWYRPDAGTQLAA